ncbi:MAG TPA: TSUP family transporter, partial [Streptosporangiaceae bacterium]
MGVTVTEAVALLAAGAGAGFISTVVGLASLISYPALLAIGLPPLAANMTNTVALLFTGVGAAAGSRPELAGQGSRIRRLGLVAALGGGAGAALLLVTPAQTFQRIAPVLIGAASLLLLVPSGARRRRPGTSGD